MLENNDKNVRLPREIIQILDKSTTGKNIDEKVRLSLTIGMFAEGAVTLERAAELAGIPLTNFIDVLRSKNIPWMEYTLEHTKEDELAIQKYKGGTT
ncbi:UPF0175 family protein [Oceanobacillus jeddahense]|uniref:UPF0175 family protein n=1 Tax=Oceanobacillus jeddahense TaxID=1462527 RepID=UPI000596388D|nr:UPF0175 family protein [Oceanobacillus jeddahense]